MNKIFLYLILLLISSISLTYSQVRSTQPHDSVKMVPVDTAHTNISGKIERLQASLDSVSIAQTSFSNRAFTLEEKIAGYEKNISIAYGLGILGILLSLIALVYISTKIRLLKDRIHAASNRRDIDDIEKKYYENKKKISESIDDLTERVNSLSAEFDKAKDVLVNEITGLSLKVDASSSLSKSIEMSSRKQEEELSSRKETNGFGKPKIYLVEYFVDNGEIKFKETNSGTPFYMDQYDDRSELTVNEAAYAPSNYSESIQKCFKVSGEMSGKYRNKKPALCSYDGNLNIWNLIQMGELDAL